MSTDANDGSFPIRTSPNGVQEAAPEDLQAKVHMLQELVCLLLAKNEKIRMALLVANTGESFDDWLCSASHFNSLCTSAWDVPARTDSLPKA
jgi:hypothetical protein